MRFENPVLCGGPRYATRDTEVNGVPVRAGDMVALCWTTANLDPEAFPDPLVVDIERPSNRHIAFAAGRHRCLGSHLARLELRTAIDELHRRLARYWITEDEVPRYNHAGVRAAEYLPLSFEVRSA
jgi:cytochrome P450